MTKKIAAVLLFVFWSIGMGTAQDIRGEFETTAYGYLEDSEKENGFLEGRLRLAFERNLFSTVSVVFVPEFRYSRFSGGVDIFREEGDRPIATLKEGYIKITAEGIGISVGKLIEDFCLSKEAPICPGDSFNRRDLVDPFTGLRERIGVTAVRIGFNSENTSFRAIYGFGSLSSRIPPRDSRWSKVPEFTQGVRNESESSGNLHISLSRRLGNTFLGFVFSRGDDYDPRPHFISSTDFEDWLTLANSYDRRTAAILEAQFNWRTTTRVSSGYAKQGDEKRIEYSVELEAQSHRAGHSFSVLGGYTGALSLDSGLRAISSEPTRFRSGFFNSFFGGLEDIRGPWILHLGFARTIESESGFAFNPEVTYTHECRSICSFLELELSALVLGGDEKNFFGQYADNDRIALKALIGF